MTIENVISKVNALKVNAFTAAQKADWLIELEGKIYIEVLGSPEDTDYPKSYPTDKDMTMLVVAPYDSLYVLYVCSMIDFYNQEINNYNNSATLFNKAYDDYRAYKRRSSRPASKRWKLW